MNSIVIKKNTRQFPANSDKNFIIPSKGMICGWKIIPEDDEQKNNIISKPPNLVLNNFEIKIPRRDPLVICLKEMRDYIRDEIYFTDNEDKNELTSLEALFSGMQIQATEFYSTMSTDEMYDCIFTRDFKSVSLEFGDYDPGNITIEETYWDRKKAEDNTEDKADENEIKEMMSDPLVSDKTSHELIVEK